MNEFKKVFEGLVSVKAILRCGCSVNEDEREWANYLCRLCKEYIISYENSSL